MAKVAISTPRRMSIDKMRNTTAKFAIENDLEYVMFIDDDVLIPYDVLQTLLDDDKDIIAGWTIIRGHPYKNMFFTYGPNEDGHRNLIATPDGKFDENAVIDVDAVGFSCVLIKTELIKKVPPPYFVTGTYNTEDVYFCVKARHYVPECTISVDCRVKTGHILGSELIAPWNKENYKHYYEIQHPAVVEEMNAREKERDEKKKELPRETFEDVKSYEQVVLKDVW
jgi:hypothetical protein